MKRLACLLLVLLTALSLACCAAPDALPSAVPPPAPDAPASAVPAPASSAVPEAPPASEPPPDTPDVDEDGYYYDLENVVLYLDAYRSLPPNYITKSQARELGWEGGTPERFLEGAAIGGDRFGNREGLLPKAEGRQYTECDLDTDGADSRGAKRLVFSNDGLYFYTEDHYASFAEVFVTEEGNVQWN